MTSTTVFPVNTTTLQPQTVKDVFTGESQTIEIIDYGDRDPLAMLLHWQNADINADISLKSVNTVKYGERLLQYNKSSIVVPDDYTKEEFDTAQKIRHYYQEKIIMKGLRGEKLTKYQSKLSRVLTDCNKLDEDAIGVLIRLPDFYREDCAMDEILKHCDDFVCDKGDEYNTNEKWHLLNNSAIESYNRKRHHRRYFLKNQKNQLVMLYANSNTPDGNAAILDALVENFNCFSISGPITKYPLPGRYFSVGTVTHRNKLKVCQ